MLLDDVLHRESLDILFKTNTNTIALVQLTNYGVVHMKLNISSLMFRGGYNVFVSLPPFTFLAGFARVVFLCISIYFPHSNSNGIRSQHSDACTHWMCVRSLPSDSVLAQDRY